MRNTLLVLALSSLTGFAQAEQDTVTQLDWAPVVASSPLYEQINTPRQECWTEQVTSQVNRPAERINYGGALFGGIAGGLLGHAVGRGGGRDAATAIGAATGAVLGDTAAARDGGTVSETRDEQHCRTQDNWTQRLVGYSVSYRYRGQEHRTTLTYSPGPAIQVGVSFTPVKTAPAAGTGWAPPPPPAGYSAPPQYQAP